MRKVCPKLEVFVSISFYSGKYKKLYWKIKFYFSNLCWAVIKHYQNEEKRKFYTKKASQKKKKCFCYSSI